MKVLITGLCLQGNKGGPAIALSLKNQIERQTGKMNFIFSVPHGSDYPLERAWAIRYGVNELENYTIKDILPPFCFRAFPRGIKRFYKWFKVFLSVDAVVEMSAISYVGPPIQSTIRTFLSGRLHYFLLAWFTRKPFFAWTQSMGPFSSKPVRFFACMDLKRQPIVFCRGVETLSAVNKMLPGKDARSYPDVAVTLDYSTDWGKNYLNRLWPSINQEKMITLSPSSVIHGKTIHNNNEISQHIEDVVGIIHNLEKRGYHLLMVPHTVRPNKPYPIVCDLALCKLIKQKVGDCGNLKIVLEDLCPKEIKSIISCAHIHIGARFHSIVAALSTGVPCIAQSWHHKYRDIMRMYGMEKYVHESVVDTSSKNLIKLVEDLEEEYVRYKKLNSQKQSIVVEQIIENAKLFGQLLKGVPVEMSSLHQ